MGSKAESPWTHFAVWSPFESISFNLHFFLFVLSLHYLSSNDCFMTGEAVVSLWNHLKSHTRRKHSRLKGSQLVLITWYFQDVRPPPLFSLHVSFFQILSTLGVLTTARHLWASALGPRPTTSVKPASLLFLQAMRVKEMEECLCLFFIPNSLQRHEGKKKVIV